MAYLMQQKARRLAFYNHSTYSRSSSPDESQQEHAATSKRHVARIDAGAPLKLLVSALEEDGCVIVTDFTDASTLDMAEQELKPWLDGLFNGDDEKAVEDGMSSAPILRASQLTVTEPHVRTINHLLCHSTTVRETLFTTPLLQSLLDHFLTLTTKHYLSSEPVTSMTPPLLSAATAISLNPGFSPQPLHRPDSVHHARHAKSASYSIGRDLSLSILVPTADTTRSTSAPLLIPGSHLWGDGRPTFDEERDVVCAEMEKGDALITLGSLYQGVGGFRTGEKNECRNLFVLTGVNGVTRPEDEAMLRVDNGAVEGWSEVVRKRLGY